jgi:hypothetical protein
VKHTKIGIVILAATAATLVACGGRGMVPTAPTAYAPSRVADGETLAQPDAGRTTAYGYLFDDPTGKPLKGIAARLYLWSRPCVATSKTTRRCPAAIAQTETNAKGRFTFTNVPSGEYLLTLGDDLASDLSRPTVHDRVQLKGGVQRLVAPTLPNEPTPAPFHMPVPAIEKSGDYRLTSIDAYEKPCITEFDAARTKRGLPPFVVDEWMTENTRAVTAYRLTVTWRTKHVYPFYAPYGLMPVLYDIGNGTCDWSIVKPAFTIKNRFEHEAVMDPRSLWIAATFKNGKQTGFGIANFPVDPRAVPVTSPPPWP